MHSHDDWAIISVELVKNIDRMNYLLNSHDYIEVLQQIKMINNHLIAVERICLQHLVSHQ